MKLELKDEPYLLIVRFFLADKSLTQWIMKSLVGKMLHVEITIVCREYPRRCLFSFAAYVDCPFEMYNPLKNNLLDPSVMNIAFRIGEQTASNLWDFNFIMVKQHTPYNWLDSRLLMPLQYARDHGTFTDVNGIPESVYCSQAVVLAMRHCMDSAHHDRLIVELNNLNSRLTSPNTLYEILKDPAFGGEVLSADDLLDITLQGHDVLNKLDSKY
jgi:hypothetical protein